MTTTMTCPKCRGDMASYERNGVLVDQCAECRGLFLDRGELEHLISAEASFGRSEPAFSRGESSFGDRPTPSDPRFHRQPHKRKKRSLFEDLFD
jgi:Zn-finger nucleic acid-binding protein